MIRPVECPNCGSLVIAEYPVGDWPGPREMCWNCGTILQILPNGEVRAQNAEGIVNDACPREREE